jgi:hypothetical protein
MHVTDLLEFRDFRATGCFWVAKANKLETLLSGAKEQLSQLSSCSIRMLTFWSVPICMQTGQIIIRYCPKEATDLHKIV